MVLRSIQALTLVQVMQESEVYKTVEAVNVARACMAMQLHPSGYSTRFCT